MLAGNSPCRRAVEDLPDIHFPIAPLEETPQALLI